MQGLNNLRQYWRLLLSHRFDNEESLNDAVQFIETSIIHSITSESDGWIFNPDFEDSSAELELSTQRAKLHCKFFSGS